MMTMQSQSSKQWVMASGNKVNARNGTFNRKHVQGKNMDNGQTKGSVQMRGGFVLHVNTMHWL